MTALVYNLILFAASPLLVAYLLYRIVVLGKSRAGFTQRLGWLPVSRSRSVTRLWAHSVSAGEAVAAAAILRHVHRLDPDLEIVVTATTPAGLQQLERLVPFARWSGFFPFDFLPCVGLALARVRPTVVAAVETEIWPNWIWLAGKLGARRALVNGQFADRGYRKARKARWLYRWALSGLDDLYLQSSLAAERARDLGAPPDRVRVIGNVKFDQAVSAPSEEATAVVRGCLGLDQGRPLWIAASTHPGEEEQVLAAYRLVLKQFPGARLLIAPRHIERAEEVMDLVRVGGFVAGRRSTPPQEPVDVLVLDTMGELAGLYRLGDAAFVGGSLAPIGGHDILQPMLQGVPVAVGPHTHNQRDVVALAVEAGAVAITRDATELAQAVIWMLQGGERRTGLVRGAGRLLSDNQGAAEACARLLIELAHGRGPRTGWGQ